MKKQILGVAPCAAYGRRLYVGNDYRSRFNAVCDSVAWLSTEITSEEVRGLLANRIQTHFNRFTNSPALKGSGVTYIDIPTGITDARFGTGEIHVILGVRPLKFPKFGCSHEFVELRTADADGAALAGFRDIAWCVTGVSKVLSAVRFATHSYIAVRGFNAQLYRAYSDAVAEGLDHFEFDVGPVSVRVAPDEDLEGRWLVTIIDEAGNEHTPDELVPDFADVIDEGSYNHELQRLRETLRHTRITVDAFTDIRHILVERAMRFPARLRDPETGEILDPALVRDSIVDSANAAIASDDLGRNYYRLPSATDPTSVHAAQIAFPIHLPGETNGRAELYGVLRLGFDGRGWPRIELPTVINRNKIAFNQAVFTAIRGVWRKRRRAVGNWEEVA